jgi:hypothetical protein
MAGCATAVHPALQLARMPLAMPVASEQAAAVVQRLPAAVDTLLQQGAAADPGLVTAPLIVNAVSTGLENSGVHHRFGGSLAARLQGAGRAPDDLDVEVENGPDVARAGDALLQVNDRIFTYGAFRARMQARRRSFVPDLHAGVSARFTGENGQAKDIEIDISNENAAVFVAGIRSPEQRGVHGAMGSLVSSPELVMNYIRRILTNPARAAQKGDRLQIAQLLRAAGFDPRIAGHVNQLRQAVEATFIGGNAALALGVLGGIINDARAANLLS